MNSIVKKWILSFLGLAILLSTSLMAGSIPGGKVWLNSDHDIHHYNYDRNTKWYNVGTSEDEWSGPKLHTSISNSLNFHRKIVFSGEILENVGFRLGATNVSFYSVQNLSTAAKMASFDEDIYGWGLSNRVVFWGDTGRGGVHKIFQGSEAYGAPGYSSSEVAPGYEMRFYYNHNYVGEHPYTGTTRGYWSDFGSFWDDHIWSFKIYPTSTWFSTFPSYNKQVGPSSVFQTLTLSQYQSNIKIGGFRGDFYEFIASTSTDPIEKKKIKSYLSFKYGINYGDTYTSSAGTVFYPSDSSYNNNVFGLGKDDGFELNQKVATSASATASLSSVGLIVSTTNNFLSWNGDANRIGLDNNQYLAFGDNGNSGISNTEFLVDVEPYAASTKQIWKVVNTNNAPGIFMKFPGLWIDWHLIACPNINFLPGETTDLGQLDDDGVIDLTTSMPNGNFYFKLAKTTSAYTFSSIVEIPKDDQGINRFAPEKAGFGDTLIEHTASNLFIKKDFFDTDLQVPLPTQQSFRSSEDPNIRYAVSEIRTEGIDNFVSPTYCVMGSCENINLTTNRSSRISYIWKPQYRIETKTSSSSASAHPLIRITNNDSGTVTTLEGVGEYWIPEGYKVEVLTASAGIDNLIVNGLTFTDSSGIPRSGQLELITIDGTEYYSNTLTENMYSYDSGTIEWKYGTKIHEFENILGEPFTLDNATVYTGDRESDSQTKTRTQVSDTVLSAIQVQGDLYKPASFLPNISFVPNETTEVNSMVYDPKNPIDDNVIYGRDIFKGNIFFTRPGRYRLEWTLGGDDFPIGADGIQKLVIEVNVKWPEDADYYHIAQTAPVSLDNSLEDNFYYKELRLVQKFKDINNELIALPETVDEISINDDKAFAFPLWKEVNNENIYRSVLFFTKSKDPNTVAVGDVSNEEVVIKVVESRHWSSLTGNYPLSEEDVNITSEITNSEHNQSVGHNGYVMQTEDLKNARYNPTTYNPITMMGEIFAVNQEAQADTSARDYKDDIVVAWYQYFEEGKLAWANKAVRYAPKWPNTQDRIVIASRLGTDGLDGNATNRSRQFKFDASKYTDVAVYNQPDIYAKGYNPNEEHALIAPSYFYSSESPKPNAGYALRNDLNRDDNTKSDYTSNPAVLIQYKDRITGKYAMKIYSIEHEDSTTTDAHSSYIMDENANGIIDPDESDGGFEYTFSYPVYAGDKVVAPYPLNTVIGANSIKESYGENSYGVNGYWEDKDTNSWAIAGDTRFDTYFWYPMLDAFWHPDSTVATGDIVPFTANSYDIAKKEYSKNESAYFVSKGEEYQNFGQEFKVVYDTYWKPNLPEIRLGETVTFQGGEEIKDNPSANGLPSVVAWASAEIIYDEMNNDADVGKWTNAQNYSVRLQPAVRELKVDMSSVDFPENLAPASKLTVNKGGNWFFEELHAGLKQRVYFDQMSNKLVLRGILNDKFAGDAELTKSPGGYNYILQPNILTYDDIVILKNLTNTNDALTKAFVQLYALSLNPNLSSEALGNIHKDTDLVGLLEDYTVGVSRFLRDKTNRFLVVKELGSSQLSQEMLDNLPNAKLPKGLLLSELELVDKSELPKGINLEDVDTILAVQNGGKLVRIKSGKKGYIPASQLGTGLALFTNPNLADPNNNFNGSHIVIAENNDPAIKGSPIQLHIMKVNNRPYRGQIKTVLSDNVFDEKITLRHTGDFGTNVKDLVFEWKYRETDGFETPPYLYADPACPTPITPLGSDGSGWLTFVDDRALPSGYVPGQGRSELVFGKTTGKEVLVDNSFYVRYKHKDSTQWSGWAGSGGNNPCNSPAPVFKSQLVKGWVKRVTDNVNVFDARIRDFSTDGAPATYVSMIEQIGQNYVGDVALNNDKDVIENVGLAELYDTVLHRAKDLSIDAAQPSSSDGLVQALQNAASRISQFYTLLGNEAYSDALDPTIGYRTSDGTYGNLAPTIFTFMNQVGTLAEEELVLLRGREGVQEGDTGAAPVHNRFLWNFTNNDGEAAYALSYNIKDKDGDGFIDYKDAKIMYPQGHGDAWGHYLTALQTYYNLLSHPEFNWVSRAEKYEIDGITLDVDYLDERRFAEAAAYKSKVGSETVALTYRQDYEESPEAQWQGYKDREKYRAWGVDGWVKRSHIGAYFDWITANAILPSEDNTHTGIQKIDRTTVGELQDIAINGNQVLTKLAEINAGQNPLGLLPDVVPFDIDPNSGESQFEQVYARADEAVKNAKNVFDYANELQHRIRQVADTQQEFSEQVYKQDMEYKNRLIEIFGTPYEGIIGAGKAYPEGYSGADINFYQYVDVAEVSEETLPSQAAIEYVVAHVKTLGTQKIAVDSSSTSQTLFAEYYPSDLPFGYNTSLTTEPKVNTLNYPLNEGRYMFQAPDFWGKRETAGSLQVALTELLKTDVDMRLAEKSYTGLIGSLGRIEEKIRSRQELEGGELSIIDTRVQDTVDYAGTIAALETVAADVKLVVDTAEAAAKAAAEALPTSVGFSTDATAPLRSGLLTFANVNGALLREGVVITEGIIKGIKLNQEISKLREDQKLVGIQADSDIKEMLLEIDLLLDTEPELRLALFRAKEVVRQATQKYTRTLGQGLRLMDEREAFNKKVAAKTHGKRYQDMAFRLNRTEASQKYRVAFDLAAKYLYLAAKAYDYETNLSPKNSASAEYILKDIVRARTIGEINGNEPVIGQGGLADIMARLKANYKVLKTQLGINNPQLADESFSLRRELFRISEDNNLSWEKTLAKHYTKNIWDLPEFRTHMRPFAVEAAGEQAGIVIPFSSNIISGLNFFGFPLSANDHAYDASQYATKIKSVGISFENYQDLGLAATTRAYLVPVGLDIMLVPDSNELDSREWSVKDQKIPVPLPFGKSDMQNSSWMPLQSLAGEEGQIRRHSRIRVYNDSGAVDANNMQKDSRLYGRSVWNTRWLLVIPGESLLNPAEDGIQTLIHGVKVPGSNERDGHGISDIKLTFETYSYSGN